MNKECVVRIGLKQMGVGGLRRLKRWIEEENPVLLTGGITESRRDGRVLM